jgi:hypothetical protein
VLLCNHVEELDEHRERLGVVVSVCADIATLRIESTRPRRGLMETGSLNACRASDHELAVVLALRAGADLPGRLVAAIPASARRASTV